MQQRNFKKQLVLVGGGHANIQVLKMQCMNEYSELHTILISDRYESTYSGLTPSYIQNQLEKKDLSIDLQRLCFNAGATFIKDSITSIDAIKNSINLKKHPSINYDILSINTGSVSKKSDIKIHDQAICIPVKPISRFVEYLYKIDKIISKEKKTKITIIGNGIAAYEISFSLYQRYKDKIIITLIGKGNIKELNINSSSRRKINNIANDMAITKKEGFVKEICKDKVVLAMEMKLKV